MQNENNIPSERDELKALSPLLYQLQAENRGGYAVTPGYFDGLEQRVSLRIELETSDEPIATSTIDLIAAQQHNLAAPSDYFTTFAARLHERIALEGNSSTDSAVLAAISKNTDLHVPADYFNTFEALLQERIALETSEPELPEVLQGLQKTGDFTAPAGYFHVLEERVTSSETAPAAAHRPDETPVIPLFSVKRLATMSAAAAAIAIGLWLVVPNPETTLVVAEAAPTEVLTQEDISNYLADTEGLYIVDAEDFSTEDEWELFETSGDESSNDALFADLEAASLVDYLSEETSFSVSDVDDAALALESWGNETLDIAYPETDAAPDESPEGTPDDDLEELNDEEILKYLETQDLNLDDYFYSL